MDSGGRRQTHWQAVLIAILMAWTVGVVVYLFVERSNDTETVSIATPSTSSTLSKTYPNEFRYNFQASCIQSGSSAPMCLCILQELEAKVPYSTMLAQERAMSNGAALPHEVEEAAYGCAAAR